LLFAAKKPWLKVSNIHGKAGGDIMDLYTARNELNKGKTIYDLPLRVTFYARVSTGTDEQTHSLKNQIDYYSEFINGNNGWTYVEGYIDEALSGTSVTKRESFLKMIEDAKLNKFDFIITKEISRFSRNTLDSIKYTQELLAAGVGVYFQSDNINTLMPDAELRLTIMSSIAQDEVRKISERVKFGFKRAIEKGVVLGNSKIWGYTKQDGKLVIDEKEAEMVKEIFLMYATQNMGIRAICTQLNERGYKNGNGNDFSFSTIKGILTNPKYMGYYCGNKTSKYDYKLTDRKYLDESDWVMYKDEDAVPPIISEEVWYKANTILKNRSKKQSSEDRTSYQNKYTYSGKIICGEHNVPYYRANYRYKSGNKEVWQCKEYSAKGKAGCISPTIYTTEVDLIMKDAYNTIIKERTNIIHDLVKIYSTIGSNSKIKEDIAKTKIAVSDIMQKKDKLLELSIKGQLTDNEFGKRNRQFNQDVENLEARITNLEDEEQKNKEIALTVETLRKMIADELDFADGFDNTIVDTLLDRIEVYKSGEKNVINLKVFFKVLNEEMKYKITRGKTTSVCSERYI
jgi:DNA invertase Pin-like site-specific DNA recombinase